MASRRQRANRRNENDSNLNEPVANENDATGNDMKFKTESEFQSIWLWWLIAVKAPKDSSFDFGKQGYFSFVCTGSTTSFSTTIFVSTFPSGISKMKTSVYDS